MRLWLLLLLLMLRRQRLHLRALLLDAWALPRQLRHRHAQLRLAGHQHCQRLRWIRVSDRLRPRRSCANRHRVVVLPHAA